MKFKVISEEQIDKLYPNNYNENILKAYSLKDLKLNTSFRYYYSYYRFHLEEYLYEILNLKEIDNKIKSLNANINYNNFYKDISNLDMDFVFIRNNIFLDRLTQEEFIKFKELYNSEEHNELKDFIENTYKKLIIFDTNISSDKVVNYDPLYGRFLAHNNALVIGIIADNNEELINYLKQKEEEYSNILNIPVKIHVYDSNIEDNIFLVENLNIEEEEKNKNILKKYSKFLPLGTVVVLKNGWKKLMIMGYSQINMDKKDKIYDYIGCLYPEGVIQTDFNILFNHEDIKAIYAIGLIDEEQKNFMENIDTLIGSDKHKEEVLKKIQEQDI